jgi:predicted KAP-like P-loop ATPase
MDSSPLHIEDDPIGSIEQDKLDRAIFSRRVAEVLHQAGGHSPSIVSALIGPWGSGKTTTLTFIADALLDQHSSDWKIVKFNPWMLESVEQLAGDLFTSIAKEIPDYEKAQKVRQGMADIAK